ncbi:hypothetical protein GOP47_0022805 [Adiantum capillus-veneris]|uniref:Uncharacterized protein n=1 Tax=Adiantum capillus-veneris TaxID=13818 RepID=A0A9D4U8E9_ADICA|nr:hypothetical protein GOP47_0022805 [Adiantum capillus-veneris]
MQVHDCNTRCLRGDRVGHFIGSKLTLQSSHSPLSFALGGAESWPPKARHGSCRWLPIVLGIMQESREERRTVYRNSYDEAGKLQKCTSSDVRVLGGMGNTGCSVDGSDQVQRVGASQCSESLSSHGSDGATGCSSCQRVGHDVHRIKKNGAVQLHCTTCVLFQYKGMYCSQCFHVYAAPDQLGDPALWLTCSKCHRFCHMECAQKAGLPTDSFFFACQYCHHDSSAENQQGNPSLKRSRTDDSCSLEYQETLAAAQIVSVFASKEAKEAKVRARACAAVAAKAAKLAKSALDVAHRAGLEELRWRLEAHRQTSVATPLQSTIRNLQSGVYMGDARSQPAVGLDDKSHQKVFMPPHHRVVGKTFGSVPDISKAAATANLSHHQRRVLPPVVSTDVSGSPFVSSHIVRKPPQQQSTTGLVGSGQRGSLPPFPKDQRLSRICEGSEVDAAPEGILESSVFVRASKSDSAAQCDTVGMNGVLPTNAVEILSDEEAVDDLVDVGDLLAEGFEKEETVSNRLIDANASGLPEGASVAQNSVEVGVAGAHTGQPPGTAAGSSQSGSALEHNVLQSVADSKINHNLHMYFPLGPRGLWCPSFFALIFVVVGLYSQTAPQRGRALVRWGGQPPAFTIKLRVRVSIFATSSSQGSPQMGDLMERQVILAASLGEQRFCLWTE